MSLSASSLRLVLWAPAFVTAGVTVGCASGKPPPPAPPPVSAGSGEPSAHAAAQPPHAAAGDLSAPVARAFAAWAAAGPTGDDAHRARLRELADAVRARHAKDGPVDVLFVCTHNSRRSHMAQLLGLAAARRAGLARVRTFSGGTEVTAFNPRAVDALRRAGLEIGEPDAAGRRAVTLGAGVTAEAFSKKLDDPSNPSRDFIVVMTCSQADAACPVVNGASKRIAIPYEDPKVADGTPEEARRYDERVAQIGRDLAWVFAEAARGGP